MRNLRGEIMIVTLECGKWYKISGKIRVRKYRKKRILEVKGERVNVRHL